MTFFYDLNRQLAAVEQQSTTLLSEGRNHLGDAEQTTYAGWKAACRRAHSGVWFDGDKDIAQAMVGPKPFQRGKTRSVGEWDGDKGSVYKSTAKAADTVSEALDLAQEELGYDSVSPEHAAEIMAHMDRDLPMSDILDEYPELSRMIDVIAGEYGLHPDDDFEEIEDILYGDLEQTAGQIDEVAGNSDQQMTAPMSEREIANDRDRKFAALAEPYDEITYADKIAGAKQGDDKVDEVAPFLAGLAAGAMLDDDEELKEAADYSAKKARAGKDIGKPGKQFAKIAKDAAARYGSKEKGEKVAGAVLAKLRSDEDLDEGKIDDLRDRQEAERRERGEEKATAKTRFVAGRAYGGAGQDTDDEDDEDAPRTRAKPATDAPRKRGRPAGSKRAIGAKGPGFKSKLLKKGAIAEYSEVDEGAIDDLRDRLEAERRERGEEKATAKTRFVAGRAYGGAGQETDDEDDEDAPRTRAKPATDAPRKRGRPVGSKRAIGAKGPGFKSKLLKKGALAETDIDPADRGEYDQEGDMAHDQLSTAKDAADELRSILTADENLPEWVQKKITMAVDYLDTARDYMKSQKDAVEPVAEKAVSKAQRTAAGIAYAAKKGDLPKSQLKGASREMAKMPAGELKKFAKTKEKGLPTKKTKEVEETTTAGSVATSGAAAPKSKGGMQFGKGIYDSLDRQLEQMIAEGMNITATVSNQGDAPVKTLSVTADGDDADRLMELLSLSGVTGMATAADHACPACGQSPCGCAELVDENSPDWPTNTEVSNDALQYSGGLNRPKSTGQTTGAIPDLSSDRQGQGYKGIAPSNGSKSVLPEQTDVAEAAKGIPHRVRYSYDDPSGSGIASGHITIHAPDKTAAARYATSDLTKQGKKNVKVHAVSAQKSVAEGSESPADYDARMQRLADRYHAMTDEHRASLGKIPGRAEQFQQALAHVKKISNKKQHMAEGDSMTHRLYQALGKL
jgi:hypothetical protein